MPFVLESTTASVTSSEEFFLNCLFTVLPSPSSSTARRFRAKLYVDDVEKPIRSAQWSVQDSSPAGTLNIELANLADRSAFTRTAEIKLDIEEYISSSWTVIKTYCEGSILATSNYVLENSGDTPNDSFSVTVLPLLQQRLDKTPDQIVVLYDPDKTSVEEDQLEVVTNVDGTTTGSVTVTPIAEMNLGDVIQWVATTIGFAGAKVGINTEPWVLARVDFPACRPYWDTVQSFLTEHQIILTVDADNYLVIRDGTDTNYVGTRTLTLSNFKGLNLQKNITRTKGCVLSQQSRSDRWDTYQLRQEVDTEWMNGVEGQYPMTQIITWYQDFYLNSFPDEPVMSQEFSVRQLEYASAGNLISASAERFSYQFGQGGVRMTRREVKEWGIAKVPQSWVTFNAALPGPNVEFAGAFGGPEDAYTSASDDTFTESFVLTKAEKTTYSYQPVLGQNEAVYAAQTDSETKGLITVDSENQMLGEDFEQSLPVAQESGNLAEGQGSRWGVIDKRKEKQRTERRKRQVQLRTRRHSALNSTSGLLAENYQDRRIGDIDESEIQTETRPIKITEGGDATATLWRFVNGGEAPLIVNHALCIRLNNLQDLPGVISGDLPTYDETMALGMDFDAQVDGRTTASVGIHRTTGYTDTFNEEGFSTAITAKQIG